MKKYIIGAVLSTSLLLSACSIGTSTQEQLTDDLAKVYEKEKGYRDAQEQIAELEKKEQSTFNSVMELTQEDKEEVASKVTELKTSLTERLALLEKENESIQGALSSLSSIDKLIEDAKEEGEKKTLVSLKEAMEARYEAYEVVYDEYQKLSTLQTELYDMLPNEKTEQVQLQEQVVNVNKQNDVVQSSINAFNETTKKVNETKTAVFDTLNEE
ncbi:YkyA family protein [Paenisporosarcina indica]|uniref:YkyA family protein n=1 Tax=Paenisporosarcina indica TaxID=650093 RepID=UPI00095006CE|nr:YkyA family protein [Paenisporosarcina indica]